MEKKKRKVINLIVNIFLTLIILVFSYIFMMIYQGKVPKFFGHGFLRVISTSMEPKIKQGDMIIVKDVDVDQIKTGDVITFYSRDPYLKGFLNTHRVVEVIENGKNGQREFVTKGDANEAADYYTAWSSKVIGRYSGKVKGGRTIVKLINLMRNRTIYFVIMILPVLLCLIHSIYVIIDFMVESKKGSDELES